MDTLPQVLSTGWASGVNAYATVLVLGIMQRLGVNSIPEELGRVEVLAVFGAFFAIELVVDKIPYVDSAWDTVHTVIRPAIGSVLGALLASETQDLDGIIAASTGGGTALASHAVKAGFRLAVNVSPEPVTNFIVSTLEDITVVSVILLSLATPWLAATLALLLLVIGLWVVVTGGVVIRRFLRRRGRPAPGPAAGDRPAPPG